MQYIKNLFKTNDEILNNIVEPESGVTIYC